MGGGGWRRIIPVLQGWPGDKRSYFKVHCKAEVPEGEMIIYALFYDFLGRQIASKIVSRVSSSLPETAGTFRINDRNCRWFNIGLYFPKSNGEPRRYKLEQLKAEQLSLASYETL